ncbi:hypothetical protein [Bacteroides sp.]|uniref:hypothetical protein n=1 Tax=Bacteroides sp. TaxID=29523 RepID=UPI00260D2449|nr:hypothetical protein [Bacteroides sp.]MDD3038260.1 hypothetical protein [Bacteroides sp.]
MSDKYTGRNLYRVEVDAKKVNELLDRLNDDEARKTIKSALRKSILIIRKQAQDNLVSAVTDAEFASTKNGVSYKALKNEINLAVYRNASGARVDMIDRRKKGSRAYMLKWFESGTKERATKKGANRGNIKVSHFFSNAVKTKQKEAENSLEKNIIDSIMKAANRKK